jgi:hypothetical protein
MEETCDVREAVTAPASTQRYGDRERERPATRWKPIQAAHQRREQVVGIEFVDDQLHKGARPHQLLGARCKQVQRTRPQLGAPSFGIEVLFLPERLLEERVDIGGYGVDLTHTVLLQGRHATFARRIGGGPGVARAF